MSTPTVLVTGAAKRIGAEIATAFARAGWQVIVHYGSSAAEAEQLARTLPCARSLQCDLADAQAAVAMIEQIAAQTHDWRALVNCASVFEPDDADALESGVYERAMQVNAQTPALMAQAFLRSARAAGGRQVIAVTDQKLANPNPDFFSYTMSKHALAATVPMLARAARREDRIYALAPGAILPSHDQTRGETEISHRLNLLQRRTTAAEIGDACLFLAQGWLASGETLFIDSGQHLLSQPRDVIYLAREGADG